VDIYIPVKDQLEMTGRLLVELDLDGDHDVTVMDNGSTEDIAGLCREHQVQYWDCEGLNIHQMWNRALKASGERHVAIINNDISLHSQAVFDTLGEALDLHPEIGVISPYFGHPDHQTQMGLISVGPDAGAAGGPAGFCFVISKSMSWYRFPENLQWWCGDIDLFCTAIHKAGKALVVHRGVTIEHLDGGSVTARSEDLGDIQKADVLEFRRMWPMLWIQDES
jgi:GT2 family glycosyltransferase